ncbi:Acyltransferase LovD [Metarhizium anisopliae]
MDHTQPFESAISGGILPCVALLARRLDNSDVLSTYLGPKSIAAADPDPIDANTIFTLASITKLATTVAALQLVERGRIQLDDDVAELLPVLCRQKIISGFDDQGQPVLQDRKSPITLRHLLTHSSGAGYTFLDAGEKLRQYHRFHGTPPNHGPTVETRFGVPLLYQPGEGWAYGAGIDWAGRLVEQLTGQSLEDYFAQHIWKPLGASGTFTFFPSAQGLAGMASRAREGPDKLTPVPGGLDLNAGVEACFGGQGGHGRADDVLKLLHSLLANDGRVLRPATADAMFRGQLSPASKAALKQSLEGSAWAVGDYYPGDEYDWGLGGLLVEKAGRGAPYARGANTLTWSGAPNLFWFIDRANGLCGLFVTQLLPPGDAGATDAIREFQKVAYQKNKTQG